MIAATLKAQRGKDGGGISHEETLVALDESVEMPLSGLQRENGSARSGLPPQIAAPLSHGSNPNSNAAGRRREDDENLVTAFHVTQDPISGDISPAMSKGNRTGTGTIGVQNGASVRRLTPTECERLQGLPDGWTDLGGTADSKRYAALGDAVTAPVAEWIGRRMLATTSPPQGDA